jgi:hypothetical protein
MGTQFTKIVNMQDTNSATVAINNLEKLIRLSDRIQYMDTKEMLKLTTTVNIYYGNDVTLTKIITKQEEVAKFIEQKVLEVQAKHMEEIRKNSRIILHFNDNDGDDIKFTLMNGIGRVFVNGVEYTININSAIPPIIEFEYMTSVNKWIWEVNFQTRKCKGRSPRTIFDKHLESMLQNDSVMEIPT